MARHYLEIATGRKASQALLDFGYLGGHEEPAHRASFDMRILVEPANSRVDEPGHVLGPGRLGFVQVFLRFT